MSRARCVPLQYLSNATHGVKARPIQATTTLGVTLTQEDSLVPLHLTRSENRQDTNTTNIPRQPDESSGEMYTPAPNMDCEQYQDLSELGWFASARQPWVAGEAASAMDLMLNPEGLAYETSIDYNMNDVDSPFYTMTRTDSMEEVKAVTAPMEVVPMRHHEALQVQDFVKKEFEEVDIQAKKEVEDKLDHDMLKVDSELFFFDSPDLLSELGDGDLIDYIVSNGSPRPGESPRTLHTPPPSTKVSPLRQETAPPWGPLTSRQSTSPRASTTSSSPIPTKQNSKTMKKTYLAIPRELTTGLTEDNKIPKMLILKTPQTSTINLQDLGVSIAERIKLEGKRPRPKRYSEGFEDDKDEPKQKVAERPKKHRKRSRSKRYSESFEEESDESEEEEDEGPSKRHRRLSTTSSNATSVSDRYRELRDKNNEASRKSRQNRKEKERDLVQSLETVERENSRLRTRSDELEKLVLSLRKLLLQIVVSKGSAR